MLKKCFLGITLALGMGLTAMGTVLASEQGLEPVFEEGIAQPVFAYDSVIREVVYVETDVDSDQDGKADLVRVLVQRPQADVPLAALFEARPYNAGCTDAYDLDAYNARIVNAQLTKATESTQWEKEDWAFTPAEPAGLLTHEEAEIGEAGNLTDVWEYSENVDAYDYWLVRGYAVVSSAGIGTLGSDGYETCGGYEETQAFASIIRWLAGEEGVKAYSEPEGGVEVVADWCNGSIAATGQSYAGATAFALATTGVEGLKTIISRAGIASWYEYYRSQGTAAGGLFYPGDDCDLLAAYCNSRSFDEEDYAGIKEGYEAYLEQMRSLEDPLSGDYNAFWDERNYMNQADQISCSAFLVHGLNDFNVRTKQFQLMVDAFEGAGQPVELILHQGSHSTPYQIEGLSYYERLGRWLAHYLYGVDNGAVEEAVVMVQDNRDLSWSQYDSWNEAKEAEVFYVGEGESSFTSDLSVTSFDTTQADVDEAWIEYCSDMVYAWEREIISGQTPASAVYTFDIPKDLHLSGTPLVTVKAAADQGTGILSAMLVDLAPEGMEAVLLGEYTERTETEVVEEGAISVGGGLAEKDLLTYVQRETDQKVITRGWMDIQNRSSIYNVDVVEPGEFYTFTLQLQPMDYTVAAGHQLALVLYSIDPAVTYWPEQVTSFTVDNAATYVEIPVRE